ncbi:MAG: oligosaccharide flippase family protein [Pseudomonadota bacterium]|nr:oligosaccharide flippase family protein [Pseudomonadota bacterium]
MSDSPANQADIKALAKGGRTNFFGFLLRLLGTAPFLFIAGRLYGVEALGVYASAVLIAELAAQLCGLGQRRGLAQRLAEEGRDPAHAVADALTLTLGLALLVSTLLYLVPAPMFPSGKFSELDRLLPFAIIPNALTDVMLAALAYGYNVGATVRARSLVEPWVQTLTAVACLWLVPEAGLALSYLVSKIAASLFAFVPLLRTIGLPRKWSPEPTRLRKLAAQSAPLAGADLVEWGSRRLDLAILGFLTTPTAVGVYFAAQQVASLPQKLKTSFEPILGPVITRNIKEGNYAAIAHQVCQVGFWIVAVQAGIALALGIPGPDVMGLIGKDFIGGTGALGFLLAAEVVAATAVVSEAALVYLARVPNLLISLGTISLQAVLTFAGIEAVTQFGYNDKFSAAAAAGSLALSLGVASLLKSRLLGRILGHSINNWRWPLVWAAAPAVVVGWATQRLLPHWASLVFGIPAILLAYGFVIWHKGFGPEDRVLFRRNVGA